MPRKKRFTDTLRDKKKPDKITAELGISEDKRLRRLGINPDGDPVAIMMQLQEMRSEYEDKKKSGE